MLSFPLVLKLLPILSQSLPMGDHGFAIIYHFCASWLGRALAVAVEPLRPSLCQSANGTPASGHLCWKKFFKILNLRNLGSIDYVLIRLYLYILLHQWSLWYRGKKKKKFNLLKSIQKITKVKMNISLILEKYYLRLGLAREVVQKYFDWFFLRPS
jgi:hypothetical protein